MVRDAQGCSRSPEGSVRQKFVETSSMTKLVRSDESSLAANFSVTFVPLYAVRSIDFWTYDAFGVDRFE